MVKLGSAALTVSVSAPSSARALSIHFDLQDLYTPPEGSIVVEMSPTPTPSLIYLDLQGSYTSPANDSIVVEMSPTPSSLIYLDLQGSYTTPANDSIDIEMDPESTPSFVTGDSSLSSTLTLLASASVIVIVEAEALLSSTSSVTSSGTQLRPRYLWDKDYSDVTLLIPMEGANAGTTFTDVSVNNYPITSTNAITSTTDDKWGEGSGRFYGNTSYIQTLAANDVALDFGTDDFTIEFWVNIGTPAVSTATYPFLLSTGDWNASDGLMMHVEGDGTGWGGIGRITWLSSNLVNYPVGSSSSTTAIRGTGWHHIALSRNGVTHRLYVDGVLESKEIRAGVTDYGVRDTPVRFMSQDENGSLGEVGYAQDLRITKGVGRYDTSTIITPLRMMEVIPEPDIIALAAINPVATVTVLSSASIIAIVEAEASVSSISTLSASASIISEVGSTPIYLELQGSYTPPDNDSIVVEMVPTPRSLIYLDLQGSYTPPANNSIDLEMDPESTPPITGESELLVTSSVVVTPILILNSQATISSIVTVSAIASIVLPEAIISGNADTIVTSIVTVNARGTFVGNAALIAETTVDVVGDVSVTGSSDLDVVTLFSGNGILYSALGSANLTCESTISATLTSTSDLSSTANATVTLSAKGTRIGRASVDLTVEIELESEESIVILAVVEPLVVELSMTSSGYPYIPLSASLSSEATVNTDGTSIKPGSGLLDVTAQQASTALSILSGMSDLTSEIVMDVRGGPELKLKSNLGVTSQLSNYVIRETVSSADLSVDSTITAVPYPLESGRAVLEVDSEIVVNLIRDTTGSSDFSVESIVDTSMTVLVILNLSSVATLNATLDASIKLGKSTLVAGDQSPIHVTVKRTLRGVAHI